MIEHERLEEAVPPSSAAQRLHRMGPGLRIFVFQRVFEKATPCVFNQTLLASGVQDFFHMSRTLDLCHEMLHLMLDYTEAALTYGELTRGYNEAQRKSGTEAYNRRIGCAQIARETAWLAWEKHVSKHRCEWPESAIHISIRGKRTTARPPDTPV